MSRSRRKSPIIGYCCTDSKKWEKRMYNRKLRHRNKQRCRRALDDDDVVLLTKRDVWSPWLGSKDGRCIFNPAEHPNLMRK